MTDDIVAAFSLDAAPVRGRAVRLGPALNSILRRHDYPWPAAMLLGEALTLAALLASLLKSEGRLVVQAQGEGLMPLLMAEHTQGGGLRGYARLSEGAARQLAGAPRLAPAALLGSGTLVITLDRGGEQASYQGVVPLEGDTLAQCAERYFRISEQTETRIALAVGEATGDGAACWRGGGLLMQRVAADETRGDPAEDWNRATHLFATVSDEELIDPDLPMDRLLYRLFHEERVRMTEPAALADRCTCSRERLLDAMRQFPPEELRALAADDGMLHARCQFCAREYRIAPSEVGVAPRLGAQ